MYIFYCTYIYILLYFRFWGTCADHAEFLHRYIHGNVVCCFHPPVTYIWHFSPCYPSLTSLPHAVPPLVPPNWPQCVMLHVFSLFNSYLWVRTCRVWFSVLVSVCCERWFPDLSMSLQRTQTHHFLWLHSIPWCICATFSLSSLSSMGICVGSRSLQL